MKYSILFLPLLASLASAQDDIWKTLAKGDRVQITFRSGNTILGNLDSKPGDPRVKAGDVDYGTATEITLASRKTRRCRPTTSQRGSTHAPSWRAKGWRWRVTVRGSWSSRLSVLV